MMVIGEVVCTSHAEAAGENRREEWIAMYILILEEFAMWSVLTTGRNC
jgi:hypothetical protein